MKIGILISLVLAGLTLSLQAEAINSPEINSRVWALLNTTYPVDVDMDGTDDLFFYGDLDALVSTSGQAYAYQLRLLAAENVYVSTIPVPAGPEEPVTVMFTTFLEGTQIDEDLTGSFFEWASGDLPFLGFDIAGGIPSRDSYLAVKIQKESSVFYGWVRLIFPITYDYHDETGYVKIKESSYQSNAFSSIIAGLGKSEHRNSFTNSITVSESGNIELVITGIEHMQCMLQESANLRDWDTVSVDYSTQPNRLRLLPVEDTLKFYRWQFSENLEEIN